MTPEALAAALKAVDLNNLITTLGAAIESAYNAEATKDAVKLIDALAALTTAIASKL